MADNETDPATILCPSSFKIQGLLTAITYPSHRVISTPWVHSVAAYLQLEIYWVHK
ncbi:hypothetical protein ACSIZT_002745 [Yersinia enterocolitica]